MFSKVTNEKTCKCFKFLLYKVRITLDRVNGSMVRKHLSAQMRGKKVAH